MRSSSSRFIDSRMIRSRPRELLPVREGALPSTARITTASTASRSAPTRPLRAAGPRDQPGGTLVADDAPEAEGLSPRLFGDSTSRGRRLRRTEYAAAPRATRASSATASRSTRRHRERPAHPGTPQDARLLREVARRPSPPEAEEWQKLFKETFVFTGGEIVRSFLLSTGYLRGAHVPGCPVYGKVAKKKPAWMTATDGESETSRSS